MLLSFLFFLLLGLVVGSFLAAFSFRLPRGISILKGRSFCPGCKKKIVWFDNVPLFSYIFLGGSCRNCKKRISPRYFLIELLTGAGFLSLFILSPSLPTLFFNLVVFCLLVLVFVVDLEHQIIPDSLVFFGIFFAFFFYLLTSDPLLFARVFSGLLAATLLMFIHLATKGRGMGLGDVKFAFFGGMISGLNLLPVWLFSSFLTGGLAGIILILTRRAGLKTKIAFGPFLVVGLAITFIWGEKLMLLLLSS
ncbi:MAG TPA: prepilin peptidase [Patescibacteria group bacterium]|nr:prepilin peptidase [Patescibacteria group bacterium]